MTDTTRRAVLAAMSALAATPVLAAGASSSDRVGDEIPPEYFTLLPDDRDFIDRGIRGLSRTADKEAKANDLRAEHVRRLAGAA